MKVREESRICFGLEWYDDEAEAWRRGFAVEDSGQTKNGGWYHGQPCGREPSFDYSDEEGRRLFAVSVA